MRSVVVFCAVVALLAASDVASASDVNAPDVWEVAPRVGATIVGPGHYQTGGLTLGVGARRLFWLGDGAALHIDLGANVIGVGQPLDHVGWICSIGGGANARVGPVDISGTITQGYGALRVANGWGLPMRYRGGYPSAGVRSSYRTSDKTAIGVEAVGLWVKTIGWEGAAMSARAVGTLTW